MDRSDAELDTYQMKGGFEHISFRGRFLRVAALILVASLGVWGAKPAVGAIDLPAPVAGQLTQETRRENDGLKLPTGPWGEGGAETISVEGTVVQRAWVVARPGLTPLQLIQPIRDALVAAGYDVLFECADRACGGFDFRFQLDLLPEPYMHVDLGDYRYLVAVPRDGEGAVSLTASRSALAGHLHLTEVVAASGSALISDFEPEAPSENTSGGVADAGPGQPSTALEQQLLEAGRAVLDDLRFETGSASLANSEFPSLSDLATWIMGDARRRVVLVGHSDAEGGLSANIALSRARAQSVADRLVGVYRVPRAQVEAEGAGYLAPRDTNETEEGRARNRRVEVVVLPAS